MVTNWTSLGSPPNVQWGSRPSVARKIDGRLEVFALDSAGALWHIQQTSPGDGWFHWSPLGRPLGGASKGLAVTQNADGRLEVFTPGNDGALWHIWQVAPNSSWSRWASLGHPPIGAPIDGPVVGMNADGRLELFAVVSQEALWHIWQTSPGDGWFHWFSSGRPQVTLDGLDVIQNADGRLEVFALAEGRSLWHIWQTAPNGTWSTWTSFGNGGPPGLSHVGAPHAAKNADGRLEVFLTNSDQTLWHAGQVTPGVWGS